MADNNPKIPSPFSERTLNILNNYQEQSPESYSCKDPRHKKPLKPIKDGLMCRARSCSYTQKWCHMFLDLPEETKAET